MTDTNQKLREALSELIEAYNRAGPGLSRAERAVDRMRLIAAHEALALPTADHIPEAGEMVVDHLPNAGKMIETAAPVGEREAFGYFYIVNGVHEGFCKGVEPPPDDSYDEGTLVPVYRSALSAGDAVDAQRTPLTVLQYNAIPELCAIPPSLYESVVRAIERAHGIDAAMRKGQL